VPCLACSATLSPTKLDALKYCLGLQKDVKIVRSHIDRPEIHLMAVRHPMGDFRDLNFVFSGLQQKIKTFTDGKEHEALTEYLREHSSQKILAELPKTIITLTVLTFC
jgi:hypothetical protein